MPRPLLPGRQGAQRQSPVSPKRGGWPGLFETLIPPETSSVEVWFERREGADVTGWDSRYGQNYRFAVTPRGLPLPERSVDLRPQAQVDPTRIRVVEDTASKAHAASGAGGAALRTGLTIRAHVGPSSSPLTAWADIHVFDASDDLIHTGTIALQKLEESAGHR